MKQCARLYSPGFLQGLQEGEAVTLTEDNFSHIKALRLQEGDLIEGFSGEGGAYVARLVALESKKTPFSAVIVSYVADSRMPKGEQTLVVGITRPQKMALILQKATELGVRRVIPVLAQRSEVPAKSLSEEKRARYEKIMHSACEQSGRNVLPTLEPLMRLDQIFGFLEGQKGMRYLLDPSSPEALHQKWSHGTSEVVWFVGPEGGWSEEEKVLAERNGVQAVSFWSTVLRMETACLAALCYGQAMMDRET